ncbi:hypothetical protein ACFWYW_46895 [Nonomuraea sp. NPDC059023]|uniref:hypothetical protein n=1 Tax=unclassified Nonomuraea TaxID=2593643 RepID=UPI003695C033
MSTTRQAARRHYSNPFRTAMDRLPEVSPVTLHLDMLNLGGDAWCLYCTKQLTWSDLLQAPLAMPGRPWDYLPSHAVAMGEVVGLLSCSQSPGFLHIPVGSYDLDLDQELPR